MIAILVYKYCQQYSYKKVYKYCYSLPLNIDADFRLSNKLNFAHDTNVSCLLCIWVKQLQYKSMQTYKRKTTQHKHNKYVNVGEIFDQREPYHLKSSNCFMKVQTIDKSSEVGLSM